MSDGDMVPRFDRNGRPVSGAGTTRHLDEDGALVRITIDRQQEGQRIDRLVTEILGDTTRAAVQRWIADGRVSLDGLPCRAKDKARTGGVLEICPDSPPPTSALPDPEVQIHVVYEDESLLVVNKQAGLVVHPGRGHRTGTLVNGLLARPGFERVSSDPRDPDGQLRPGIVHRIDKDTSGLLVVAKNERTREGLKSQLAAHSVVRRYRAITVGVPSATTISTLHGRDPHHRLKFSSRVASGKTAVTHLEVVERLAGKEAALVECRLETGRTHQIRVHLSQEAGTPLLGDQLYGKGAGSSRLREVAQELGRQALHAGVLGFVHPETGQELSFECPLPFDMNRALVALGGERT